MYNSHLVFSSSWSKVRQAKELDEYQKRALYYK